MSNFKSIVFENRLNLNDKKKFSHINKKNLNSVGMDINGSLSIKENKTILFYICGPTVYDETHLGHAKTYYLADTILKTLRLAKYDVKFLMNITDIDKKILDKTQIQLGDKSRFKEISQEYLAKFLEDMALLGVEFENIKLISDNIGTIINHIQKLIINKLAYISNNSVYLNTEKLPKYCQHIFTQYQKQNDFDDKFKGDKKNNQDFVLWKKSEDFGFESPFGKGIPGWHSECASLIWANFKKDLNNGKSLFHMGGIDLCFPHHENELKQIMAMNQKPYKTIFGKTKYDSLYNFDLNCFKFAHIGHLNIKGHKMSKSEKNFITLYDFIKDNEKINDKHTIAKNANSLKLMFLKTNYQLPSDFSIDYFNGAMKQWEYFMDFMEKIRQNIIQLVNNYFGTILSDLTLTQKINIYNQGAIKLTEYDPKYDYEFDDFKDKITAIDNDIQNLLFDNFQFNKVIIKLYDFRSEYYKYLQNIKLDNLNLKVELLLFNLYDKYLNQLFNLGFSKLEISNNNVDSIEDKLLNILVQIRDEIRDEAKNTKNKQLYKLSDKIRDEYVKDLNIQIQDENNKSIWKRI